MIIWPILLIFFFLISIPATPETPATPAQTILFFVLFFSIFLFVMIGNKLFPVIELPKNKSLAYDFHLLGMNLKEYTSSSGEEYRMTKLPEIKRSLESCEEKLTEALSGLPDFWAGDMESSLKSLQSAIYKINHAMKKQEIIDEKLLKGIFDLSDSLHEEKNLSPSLKRRITTIGSLLKKTEEELIKVPLLSRLLKSIVTFPKWWRTQSTGIRFFINCLILIPIGCGATYFFSVSVFLDVSINYVYVAVMAVLAACIGASAALAR